MEKHNDANYREAQLEQQLHEAQINEQKRIQRMLEYISREISEIPVLRTEIQNNRNNITRIEKALWGIFIALLPVVLKLVVELFIGI